MYIYIHTYIYIYIYIRNFYKKDCHTNICPFRTLGGSFLVQQSQTSRKRLRCLCVFCSCYCLHYGTDAPS